MKYKLSQKQLDEKLEELKNLEFEELTFEGQKLATTLVHLVFDRSEMEPIAEPLPKPTIRNVEDLKALDGWEITDILEREWFEPNNLRPWYKNTKDLPRGAKIRQISDPSNSFLLSECIEPEEIEVGDLCEFLEWSQLDDFDGTKKYGIVEKICRIVGVIFEGENGYGAPRKQHKLIRKAKDITIEDRVKYLGETPMEIEVTDGTATPKKSVGEIMEDIAIPNSESAPSVKGSTETWIAQEEPRTYEDVKLFSDAQLEQISKIIDDKLKERGE